MRDSLFPSVTAALMYWRRWQEAMRSGMAINPEPRESDGSMPLREEILATYLSVDRVVEDTLTDQEKRAVDSMINDPGQKPDQRLARVWHRAATKLGKEMHRRGLVGEREVA